MKARWRIRRRVLACAVALVATGCTAVPAQPVESAPTETRAAVGGPIDVANLPRIPWEGGPDYYRQFPQAAAEGWTNPAFFPVAVWFESVLTPADVARDRAIGLNTYMELTPNSDVDLIRRNGMTAITSTRLQGAGDETVGWLLSDEPDMWGGPGDAPWTGKYPGYGDVCSPASAKCGFTVLRTLGGNFPPDGRMRYVNYGKGVYLWYSDDQAAAFVNNFTHIVSTDIYWYTDPNICSEALRYRSMDPVSCRVAANYGLVVDRGRELDALDGKRQPVFGFVEDGLPFTDGNHVITGDEMQGAVMNSLIHEARGIIYFNHNFSGNCQTQHVFREPCGELVRPAAKKVNAQIAQLAPVLNTQSYQYVFNRRLDTMLKSLDGSYYVFAMVGRGTPPGTFDLTLPPGLDVSSAEVLFEDRTVPVVGGRMSDEFAAEYTYHVYKITP